MVGAMAERNACRVRLSVLALSSRFDGLPLLCHPSVGTDPFSTRSVESF